MSLLVSLIGFSVSNSLDISEWVEDIHGLGVLEGVLLLPGESLSRLCGLDLGLHLIGVDDASEVGVGEHGTEELVATL
jgi:hypothetical protein